MIGNIPRLSDAPTTDIGNNPCLYLASCTTEFARVFRRITRPQWRDLYGLGRNRQSIRRCGTVVSLASWWRKIRRKETTVVSFAPWWKNNRTMTKRDTAGTSAPRTNMVTDPLETDLYAVRLRNTVIL